MSSRGDTDGEVGVVVPPHELGREVEGTYPDEREVGSPVVRPLVELRDGVTRCGVGRLVGRVVERVVVRVTVRGIEWVVGRGAGRVDRTVGRLRWTVGRGAERVGAGRERDTLGRDADGREVWGADREPALRWVSASAPGPRRRSESATSRTWIE